MRIVASFNPATATSNTVDFVIKNGGHIVVINESANNMIFKFGNGNTTYIPANDRRAYQLEGQGAQPHTVINWSIDSTLPNLNTVNICRIEGYDPGEKLPETYPAPLFRQTQATGSINATSISNAQGGSFNFIIGAASGSLLSPDFVANINGSETLGGGVNTGILTLIDVLSSTHEIFTAGIAKLTGATAGTVTLWQPLTGDVKLVLGYKNGFQNNSGANQSLVLPQAFVTGAIIITGGTGATADNSGIGCAAGVTLQAARVLTTLAVGGGTVTNAVGNLFYQNSTVTVINAFDTLQFQSGNTAAHTGHFVIIGN